MIFLPPEVAAVFREFRVCELTTLAQDGTPTTWPLAARYQPDGRFLMTTSIGFPQKAFNIRRNPRVSMLFSDSTGSGLNTPPAVLVQGDAVAEDKIITSVEGLEEYWRETIFRRQPASEIIGGNAITPKLMDWYYMRLLIFVTPRLIQWWPNGDFTQPAHQLEVNRVE